MLSRPVHHHVSRLVSRLPNNRAEASFLRTLIVRAHPLVHPQLRREAGHHKDGKVDRAVVRLLPDCLVSHDAVRTVIRLGLWLVVALHALLFHLLDCLGLW